MLASLSDNAAKSLIRIKNGLNAAAIVKPPDL
jgi:hypothetical protein